MGDRGYREHSAGISCCHSATEKRGARGASEYRCERTAVSTLRTDIKTGCLHSAGAPFWSFDSRLRAFIFAHGIYGSAARPMTKAARPATSRPNFVNRSARLFQEFSVDTSEIAELSTYDERKSGSICIRS